MVTMAIDPTEKEKQNSATRSKLPLRLVHAPGGWAWMAMQCTQSLYSC